MSDTISAVAAVTQPGTVYHGPRPPSPGSANVPRMPSRSTDDVHENIARQWGPRCPLAGHVPATTFPPPVVRFPVPSAAGNLRLETQSKGVPVASGAQRYARRPVKLRFAGDAASLRPCPTTEQLFMGVAIAVLLAANCVAIGTAIAHRQ
jgi:hypothetical protein